MATALADELPRFFEGLFFPALVFFGAACAAAGLGVGLIAEGLVVADFLADAFFAELAGAEFAGRAFAAANSSDRRACSSRALTAISLTASNSSRVTRSMRLIRSSARRRIADRVEPRMPTATLSAPDRTPATSSTKRRIPNLPKWQVIEKNG